MFKKIAGLFLAATLMISSAAISVSAAEVDTDSAVAAEGSSEVGAEGSSEVGAEGSSEVGAEASSEVGAGNEIYFDVKSSGWGNIKTIYCHIWKADGTGTSEGEDWPAWQGKAEKCKYDASKGIATYDLSQTGHKFNKSDGKIYCVIFSANTGMQTYNAIMSGNCIGDTLYCTGNKLENPEDSAKTAIEASWRNNSDCGAERKITSTGKVVGNAFPEGQTDVTMMATYLIQYYEDPAKTDLTADLMKELNLTAEEVMGAVNDKLAATANKDADKISKAVADILAKATGGNAEDIKKNAKTPSQGGTTNNSTGTVKSGQETTIFIVFASLMLAAAGVMFLSRKKREE